MTNLKKLLIEDTDSASSISRRYFNYTVMTFGDKNNYFPIAKDEVTLKISDEKDNKGLFYNIQSNEIYWANDDYQMDKHIFKLGRGLIIDTVNDDRSLSQLNTKASELFEIAENSFIDWYKAFDWHSRKKVEIPIDEVILKSLSFSSFMIPDYHHEGIRLAEVPNLQNIMNDMLDRHHKLFFGLLSDATFLDDKSEDSKDKQKEYELQAEIEEYRRLPDNFDGDGGRSPAKQDVENALSFIKYLPKEGMRTVRVMVDGTSGISFEWGLKLELWVDFSNGKISFFGDMPNGESIIRSQDHNGEPSSELLQLWKAANFPTEYAAG